MRYFREVLGAMVIVIWAWMVFKNSSEPLIVGAMIAMSTSVVAYYFAASKTGNELAQKNADRYVQPVEVINSEASPVATKDVR